MPDESMSGTLTLPALTLTGALSVVSTGLPEPAHGFPLRAQLAAALSEVEGVSGFSKRPTSNAPGDAWPRIGQLVHVSPGAFETSWEIVVRIPDDELAQDDWIVAKLELLTEALAPLVWIENVQLGASSDSPVLLINCRE